MEFRYAEVVDVIGQIIDFIGVAVITLGILLSLSKFLSQLLSKEKEKLSPYNALRFNLARTILLGLEFLVAGDIVRSIATPPTFNTVIILALIVLIRSFLSWEFEKRTEGYAKFSKEKEISEK